MKVETERFGQTADGQDVFLYTFSCGQTVARVMSLGATLVNLQVPSATGQLESVVLHLDTLDDYLAGHPCFGSVCGRFANRIANGTFTLDGRTYTLAQNNGKNHLHGGREGFHQKVWRSEAIESNDFVGVKLSYTSPDGEEGYPGTLTASITYKLSGNGRLELAYEAVSDKSTVLNLTNHTYWNLTGNRRDVLDHTLYVNADHYLAVDSGLIPTGEILPVAGTPFDFTDREHAHTIGERINQTTVGNPPEPSGGYDHCFCLNKAPNRQAECTLVAHACDPQSGRKLTVFSTEPGVQLYTTNGMNRKGAMEQTYKNHWGFCLELQHYPDSPNKPSFPSVVLRPGETYRQQTIYAFH